MKFFLDNCISPSASLMLDAFSAADSVTALSHHFATNTPDVDWMRTIAQWDPVPFVLTGDLRILRRPLERRALRESGLTMFMLGDAWAHKPWHDYAWRLVRVWPLILGEASRNTHATIYEVGCTRAKIDRLPNA